MIPTILTLVLNLLFAASPLCQRQNGSMNTHAEVFVPVAKPSTANGCAPLRAKITITDADETQLLKLMLERILMDKTKRDRLKESSNLVLLKEDIDFKLPAIRGASLQALTLKEIQERANDRGRVFYLVYQPMSIEDRRVIARLAVRDRVKEGRGLHVPYKYMFAFTFIKRDSQWIMKTASGHAQS